MFYFLFEDFQCLLHPITLHVPLPDIQVEWCLLKPLPIFGPKYVWFYLTLPLEVKQKLPLHVQQTKPPAIQVTTVTTLSYCSQKTIETNNEGQQKEWERTQQLCWNYAKDLKTIFC